VERRSQLTTRAVVDTSSLFLPRLRAMLQQAAQLGAFTAIWSPWIIAELNRVLTWDWIRRHGTTVASERRCSEAANRMMGLLLPCFEVVTPAPPYPLAWEQLTDVWDHPIWAAVKEGHAQYVVSENARHYPPVGPDGRHNYEGIEYLSEARFVLLLSGDLRQQ